MKIEQQVGGDAPTQDAYTGATRQLTADTDNWDLRLHDGVTPGGHRILNRDNNDERYQAASAELTGISGFPPEKRGFLVRVAAGQYRIRTWEWNLDQFTIANPNGYSGNPSISLNERIETDHIFGNNLIVEGVLAVIGGVNADTSGTHYGDVVGNLTGNVTGNLLGNALGNHTGSFTGDVDVRGQTLSLDANQIATSAINGLEDFVKLNAIPFGCILLWSGIVASIPAGWYLCNGLNGTPDLRDRFVAGAGSIGTPPGTIGGASTHSHASAVDPGGSHTHAVTVDNHVLVLGEIPGHNHGNGITDQATNQIFPYGYKASPTTLQHVENSGSDGAYQGLTETVGGNAGHNHTAAAAASTHTHTLDNAVAGNIPPYYALCYIMRAA